MYKAVYLMQNVLPEITCCFCGINARTFAEAEGSDTTVMPSVLQLIQLNK